MKAVIIRARDNWKAGEESEVNASEFAVLAEEGEYWDKGGVEALRFAFRAAKAAVTGNPVDVGDQHAKVKL